MRKRRAPLPVTYSSMFTHMPTHYIRSSPVDHLSIPLLVPDTTGESEMFEVGDRFQEGETRLQRIEVWPE